MKAMDRRAFLRTAGAVSSLSVLGACAGSGTARARVVVLGGGYGGATAAKYLRLWDPSIEVTLVERSDRFISCPMSNLVLGGHRRMDEITRGYDGLRRHGVRIVHDEATAVEASKRVVRLARGSDLAYDRLIVAPGVDFMFNELPAYEVAMNAGRVLHAWKAGPQTVDLRRRLEEMRDGGVYAISIPLTPYRCPPGPYERACMVASYFRVAKPRSKVLILDANPEPVSKGPLFRRAWEDLYKDIIEYRGNAKAIDVDPRGGVIKLEEEDVRADVLNVVPPQRAGDIAVRAGLITHNNRWCDVDWRSGESKAVPGVHVLGDATLSAPGMPKSGHMANQHAKVCAAAVIEQLSGRTPSQTPVLTNTCYSFVSRTEVVHVASVHQWDAAQSTVIAVKNSGGVSAARSEEEGRYGWSWAQNIWADMLA